LKIKPVEGAAGWNSSASKGRISAQRITMANFADALSRRVGSPVTDLTGVSGGDASDVLSALFAALQDQLGVKLEMRKLPVDVLVIDKAEKPSEN
jgi:hypothetical protein